MARWNAVPNLVSAAIGVSLGSTGSEAKRVMRFPGARGVNDPRAELDMRVRLAYGFLQILI
jgi:hypothetical protein